MAELATFFGVTAKYSNAVLVAILPYVSDFARKLDLPVATPITTNDVAKCNVMPHNFVFGADATLRLTNGYQFSFSQGHITSFNSPDSLALAVGRSVPSIASFFGDVKITREQAVELVRSAIRKLGYSEEMLYVDLEPTVKLPERLGQHMLPFYTVEWTAPNGGDTSVRAEVNGATGRITYLFMVGMEMDRPPPKLPPEVIRKAPQPPPDPRDAVVDLRGAGRDLLLKSFLPRVDDFIKAANLPLPRPITAKDIKSFEALSNVVLGVTATLTLTNDHSFSEYTGGMGYGAPDRFFDRDQHVRVRDYVGPWRMTQLAAIRMVRDIVSRLGYSLKGLGMDKRPQVERPHLRGKISVPRFEIDWEEVRNGGRVSAVMAEVDANLRQIKWLTIYGPPGASAKPQLREGPSGPPGPQSRPEH